ncbi:putative inorganic carbon transporter subunit DabA, partial [Kaarinaea lacus]
VGQWINMEHYFSTVDNEHYGSGSKVYHNVAGRFGVMTGNLSDLRTGLPAQTVLAEGKPYHEPMRLITVVEAPFKHVLAAIDRVAVVRKLLNNGWIRLLIIDPESGKTHVYFKRQWHEYGEPSNASHVIVEEAIAS